MKGSWYHHALAVVVVSLFLGLHYWWRWQGVPFVAWSLVLPVFIAFTYRNSLLFLLVFILSGELLSFLPPGVMTVICTLPYLTSRLLIKGVQLWSWRLWLSVAGTVGLQLLLNLMGYLWGEGLLPGALAAEWWLYIPWWHLIVQWLIGAFLLALTVGTWHEVNPSVASPSVAK